MLALVLLFRKVVARRDADAENRARMKTEDTFIADLAVTTGFGCRSERIAKLNPGMAMQMTDVLKVENLCFPMLPSPHDLQTSLLQDPAFWGFLCT